MPVDLMPGNPAVTLAGEAASPEKIAAISKTLNLNDAMVPRFWYYVSGIATGDFGKSLFASRPVLKSINEALPVTLSSSSWRW